MGQLSGLDYQLFGLVETLLEVPDIQIYYQVPNKRPGRLFIFWEKFVNRVVIRNWSLINFGHFVNLVVKSELVVY